MGRLGPYRVLKQLGKGGMGAVYLALDSRLGRKIALKVMLPKFAADRDARERFLREARAAAQIAHDNVVPVFEADERDGVPYIAMPFLQGYPLDDSLRNKGDLKPEQIMRVGAEFKAQFDPPNKTNPPRVARLVEAWADYRSGGDSVEQFAIDGMNDTGWVTDDHKPHFAVFRLAELVATPDGTALRVTLEFGHDVRGHSLGCFRLSATPLDPERVKK